MPRTAAAAGLAVEIRVDGGGWGSVGDVGCLARAALQAAWDAAGNAGAPSEVSVLLADDEAMRALNLRYRGRDRATNVLSFASDPPLLGDIVLAWGTVAAEAARQGKPVADHAGHLLVHGLLHLLGHDHHDQDGRARMEALEVRVLGGLGIPDPYVLGDAVV